MDADLNIECFQRDVEYARDWGHFIALVAKTPKANTTLAAKTRRKSSSKMASEIREGLSALPVGHTGQHRAGGPEASGFGTGGESGQFRGML